MKIFVQILARIKFRMISFTILTQTLEGAIVPEKTHPTLLFDPACLFIKISHKIMHLAFKFSKKKFIEHLFFFYFRNYKICMTRLQKKCDNLYKRGFPRRPIAVLIWSLLRTLDHFSSFQQPRVVCWTKKKFLSLELTSTVSR